MNAPASKTPQVTIAIRMNVVKLVEDSMQFFRPLEIQKSGQEKVNGVQASDAVMLKGWDPVMQTLFSSVPDFNGASTAESKR
jgi:hypothetical protein